MSVFSPSSVVVGGTVVASWAGFSGNVNVEVWKGGSLWVNDDAQVIIPDVDASNGVIHVVDAVIVGPWPKAAE